MDDVWLRSLSGRPCKWSSPNWTRSTRSPNRSPRASAGAGRAPPLAPVEFAARLETKSFTSKKADLAIVTGIYERAFEQRVGAAERLFYGNLGWGDAEAAALARALGAAAACRKLILGSNAIGDAGAAALAAALREGAAPKLTSIDLRWGKNPASAAAVRALRDARGGLRVSH